MDKGKVIDINEYRFMKANRSLANQRRNHKDTEEERKETLSLFMKVLATMNKESYK